MRLVPYTKGNLALRHSLLRLAGAEHLTIHTLSEFMNGDLALKKADASLICRVDRCVSFIEGVKTYRMLLDSEDFIITLVTFFPENMMEESALRSEFPKEMSKLKTIMQENVKQNLKVFTAAKNVLDFVSYSRLVKSNTLPVNFLIANLMIVHSDYLMVLEDTDSVDPGLMMELSMVVTNACGR